MIDIHDCYAATLVREELLRALVMQAIKTRLAYANKA
jgi:hypothetical protein